MLRKEYIDKVGQKLPKDPLTDIMYQRGFREYKVYDKEDGRYLGIRILVKKQMIPELFDYIEVADHEQAVKNRKKMQDKKHCTMLKVWFDEYVMAMVNKR